MRRRPTGRVRGVTLVELMVVVAVIGLLSAMFLSRMSDARRDAQDSRVVNLLNELRTAVISYELKTGSFPMTMWWHGNGQWDAWVSQIQGQVGDLKLPSQSSVSGLISDGGFWPAWASVTYPYGMLLQVAATGHYFLATPYELLKCPQHPDTAPCVAIP